MLFIERVENQQARLDRKLFVYNGGHAATAYFGHRRGHEWIHEAVADEQVVGEVDATLNELAAVVQRRPGAIRRSPPTCVKRCKPRPHRALIGPAHRYVRLVLDQSA